MLTLHLPHASLRYLPDVTHLPLEKVNLESNKLTSLEGLPFSLKEMNVSDNRLLGDGILFPFPHLQILNFRHNHIHVYEEDDFVICFPSLQTLDFSHNSLRHTGFLRQSTVEDLNVSHNRLVTVTGLPQTLKTFRAESNEITMVQSKLPPFLTSIHLAYNALKFAGLPLNWPATLRELHLDNNCIEKFPRKLPDSLEVLTLNQNNLIELPAHLPSNLQLLSVCSNKLRVVPGFSRKLKVCLLDDNCLVEIPEAQPGQLLSAENNWTSPEHKEAQQRIRSCWKRFVLQLRLRHFKRTHVLREELYIISMHPDRWNQIDSLDSVWFRKTLSHNRTDRPKD
jgi:Leucine-rich repeat (LRR) protein